MPDKLDTTPSSARPYDPSEKIPPKVIHPIKVPIRSAYAESFEWTSILRSA